MPRRIWSPSARCEAFGKTEGNGFYLCKCSGDVLIGVPVARFVIMINLARVLLKYSVRKNFAEGRVNLATDCEGIHTYFMGI